MRLPTALFAAALVATVAAAQPEAPVISKEDRAKIVERLAAEFLRSKTERAKDVELLKAARLRLEGAKAGKVNRTLDEPRIVEGKGKVTYTFPTEEAKAKWIESAKNSVAQLERRVAGPDPADPDTYFAQYVPPKVGSFGMLSDAFVGAQVERIIGPMSFTAGIRYPGGGEPVTVLISGIDTAKMADKVGAVPTGVYFVRGTTKVRGGTHFELVPFRPTADEIKAIAGAK